MPIASKQPMTPPASDVAVGPPRSRDDGAGWVGRWSDLEAQGVRIAVRTCNSCVLQRGSRQHQVGMWNERALGPLAARRLLSASAVNASLIVTLGYLCLLCMTSNAAAETGQSVEAGLEPAKQATLSLAALVQEALERHPTLARARHLVRAASEVPDRASSLPDPMFSVGLSNLRVDDPMLDASPMSGVVFALQQVFPGPGKLSRREAVARANVRVTEENEDLLQVLVPLLVKQRYWALHYAEHALTITNQSERVVNTLTDVIHTRFSVGQGAQQDALQAQTAHSRVRAMLQEQRQAMISARRALNEAVGRKPEARLPPTTEPPEPRPLDRAAWMARLEGNNPQLAVARAEIDAARAGLEEARRDRWPDFMAGVGYRLRAASPGDMSQGADMFSVTLGITLPIWAENKQNARVRENVARIDAALAAQSDVRLRVRSMLARAIDELERLASQIELYRKELLPEADEALNASIEDYHTDQVGFVSVLDNWRATLDLQLMLERLRVRHAQLMAEVEALVGGWSGKAVQ